MAADLVLDEATGEVNVEPSVEAQTAKVSEVVNLREEYVKHYDMGDGTFTAAVYPFPIHILDESGNWIDIDNAMPLFLDDETQDKVEALPGLSFSKSIQQGSEIFKFGKKDYNVGLSVMSENNWRQTRDLSVSNSSPIEAVFTKNNALTEVTTDGSDVINKDYTTSVLYENVFPSVDLEYIYNIGCVKENIIINQRLEDYCFTFSLELDNLLPVLENDGSISLNDLLTGERVYVIPSPFMYDSAMVASEKVHYTLSVHDGSYLLGVIADSEWINNNDRSFPVVIDPTITEVMNSINDVHISSANPSTNYASSSLLWVSGGSSSLGTSISYLKQTALPSLPAGSLVSSTHFNVNYFYNDYVNSGYVGVTVHRVNSAWEEYGLTWNGTLTQNNHGFESNAENMFYTYPVPSTSYSSPGNIHINVTDLMMDWYYGVPNHGLALNYFSGPNLSVFFLSSETVVNNRPYFTITYTCPQQLTEYKIYSYIDPSIADSSMITGAMSDLLDFLNHIYNDEFNIGFTDGGICELDSYPTSECPYGNYSGCIPGNGCSMICTNHHKNISHITDAMLQDSGPNEIHVLWSNCESGVYCTEENGVHTVFSSGTNAVVYNFSNAIIFQRMQYFYDGGYLKYMSLILAHEIVHTFGMEDVYGLEHDDLDQYICIMDYYDHPKAENFYESIEEATSNAANVAFCDSCLLELHNHI